MGRDSLGFETLRDIRQSIVHCIHIGVIDLVRVPCEYELGPFPCTGQYGFDFMRRQVLRFVDNQELFRNGAPANVGQGLDFDRAALEQLFVRFLILSSRLANVARNSTLSWMGCIHGLSFSSRSPGRYPRSLPRGKIGRDTSSFRYRSSSMV